MREKQTFGKRRYPMNVMQESNTITDPEAIRKRQRQKKSTEDFPGWIFLSK